MTKRRVAIAVFGLLLVVTATAIKAFSKKANDDRLAIELKTIKVNGGWGYDIFVDHKIFIHQASIPAIDGLHPFNNKATAQMVGSNAIKKLASGKMPVITREELMQWGVIDK